MKQNTIFRSIQIFLKKGFWSIRDFLSFINSKIIFFFFSLIITLTIAYFLDFRLDFIKNNELLSNISIEFHGLIFDIILFGLLFTIFEGVQSRKSTVIRLLEELDDFNGWDSELAARRIKGIWKRLNKNKHYSFPDLYRLKFSNLGIENLELRATRTKMMCFYRAWLEDIKFQGCELNRFLLFQGGFDGVHVKDSLIHMGCFIIKGAITEGFYLNHTGSLESCYQYYGRNDGNKLFKHLNSDFTECILEKGYLESSDFISCRFFRCAFYGVSEKKLREIIGSDNLIDCKFCPEEDWPERLDSHLEQHYRTSHSQLDQRYPISLDF